jgi:hypothetical protein
MGIAAMVEKILCRLFVAMTVLLPLLLAFQQA